jgi:hypothetical protein
VLEGHVTVAVDDTLVTVPPGARTRIPLDDDGAAARAPTEPEPYGDLGALGGVLGLLPTTYDVPPEITAEALDAILHPPIPDNALYTDTLGDICAAGSVTRSFTFSNPVDNNPDWLGISYGSLMGGGKAIAGVTATFTVSGDVGAVDGIPNVPHALVYLRGSIGNESAHTLAASGDSPTLTYTFTEDTSFSIMASTMIVEGQTAAVTLTATCTYSPPATPVPQSAAPSSPGSAAPAAPSAPGG